MLRLTAILLAVGLSSLTGLSLASCRLLSGELLVPVATPTPGVGASGSSPLPGTPTTDPPASPAATSSPAATPDPTPTPTPTNAVAAAQTEAAVAAALANAAATQSAARSTTEAAKSSPTAPPPTTTPTPQPTATPPPTRTAVPSLTPTPPITGRVTSDTLNVRDGPGANYPKQGELRQGDRFTVLECNPARDWLRVRADSGVEGWVSAGLTDVGAGVARAPVASA